MIFAGNVATVTKSVMVVSNLKMFICNVLEGDNKRKVFIPILLNRAEVRALCSSVKFLNKLRKAQWLGSTVFSKI